MSMRVSTLAFKVPLLVPFRHRSVSLLPGSALTCSAPQKGHGNFQGCFSPVGSLILVDDFWAEICLVQCRQEFVSSTTEMPKQLDVRVTTVDAELEFSIDVS